MKRDHHLHSSSLFDTCKDTKNSTPEMIIIKSQGTEFECLFDKIDSELVCRFRWNLNNKGYAVTCINRKTILMHRLILGVEDPDIQVDHKHHNKLDNRRENIRVCTCSENRRNSRKLKITAHSEFKGIYFDSNRWHAQIMQNSMVVNLGRYRSEKTAAKVYDIAARHIFKDFAFLNFPDFQEHEQLVIPGLL